MEFHFEDSSSCRLYFYTTESKAMEATNPCAKPSHDLEKWAEYLSLQESRVRMVGEGNLVPIPEFLF